MLLISQFLDKHSIMVYSWTIKMSSNGQNKESQTHRFLCAPIVSYNYSTISNFLSTAKINKNGIQSF